MATEALLFNWRVWQARFLSSLNKEYLMAELEADRIEKEARVMLAPFGLFPLGWFRAESRKPAQLIGNIGSSMWPNFASSNEIQDGELDGMDRWTILRINPIATQLGAEARFPFGNKVWPFQQYAKQAMGIRRSPIGLLIHPEYGLWSAFRAVLVFENDFELPPNPLKMHPCDNCKTKPCLTTCPISAFGDEGYDYIACKKHVKSAAGKVCKSTGCIARKSCPVGQQHAYETEHQAFHMEAYV